MFHFRYTLIVKIEYSLTKIKMVELSTPYPWNIHIKTFFIHKVRALAGICRNASCCGGGCNWWDCKSVSSDPTDPGPVWVVVGAKMSHTTNHAHSHTHSHIISHTRSSTISYTFTYIFTYNLQNTRVSSHTSSHTISHRTSHYTIQGV